MTWGQLRLQLQTAAPGVSLDLLDEYLNGRYEQVLEANDWKGARYHTTLQTQAAYQSATDTATLTVGSVNVTGVGTAWTSALIGQRMYRPGDTVIYTIATVPSGTSLTLDRAYEGNGTDATGTVYSGAAYVFMQHIYALPADVGSVIDIIDPVTGVPLEDMSKAQLDASAGPRTLVNDPKAFCVYDDSNESTLPVSHQVEFWPPPLRARGFVMQYLHAAIGFNGSNTTGAPLPWVSTSVLLYGCRADIAAYLAGQSEGQQGAYLAQAKLYETKFQEELARLLRKEHNQRRVKPVLRMAARFTRHRLARAGRGLNNWWGPGQGGPN